MPPPREDSHPRVLTEIEYRSVLAAAQGHPRDLAILQGEWFDAEARTAVNLVALDGRQYGTMGFTPSWPAFPTPGYWKITGRVGDQELVFRLEVVFVDSDPTSATDGYR